MSDESHLVPTAPVDPHVLVLEHIDFRLTELRDIRKNLRDSRDMIADMLGHGADLAGAVAKQDQRIKLVDDLIDHYKTSRTVLQRAQHPSAALDTGTHKV